MNKNPERPHSFLRKAIAGNAVFSFVSGVLIVVLNRWLVKFMGLPGEVSLAALGFGLLVYAVLLWLNIRRPEVKLSGAWVAVIMDGVWVIGSYALIFVIPFSVGGKWVVGLVAELVLAFAILQWFGIRKVRKSIELAR